MFEAWVQANNPSPLPSDVGDTRTPLNMTLLSFAQIDNVLMGNFFASMMTKDEMWKYTGHFLSRFENETTPVFQLT